MSSNESDSMDLNEIWAGQMTGYYWTSTSTVPLGWLKCDGSTILANQYPKLYQALLKGGQISAGAFFALPNTANTIIKV